MRLTETFWYGKKICFLACVILFGQNQIQAQEFKFPDYKKREAISFKFIKNLIIIPVTINGKGPFNFVLDTGVGLVLITDYTIAEQLQLSGMRSIKLMGLGEKEDLDALISPALNLGIGSSQAANIHAAILKKDVFNLSEYVGLPIHGLLGYEFFNSFIVRINYLNQTLTIYTNNNPHILRKGYKIPISIEEHKPYLETPLTLGNGSTISAKLVMDTGAGHPLSLENSNGIPFPIPQVNIADNLGVGLAGPINGYLARTPTLNLGKYKLNGVITAFPNYDDVGSKITVSGRNGNLGNGILKHFEPLIDYSRRVMYIKPSAYFKEPFEYDMSGLTLSSPGPDYTRLIVSRVAPNSPAEEEGINAGDEILHINLKSAAEIGINGVYDLFKSGNEKSFLLDILPLNSEKRKKIIFTLKRRI